MILISESILGVCGHFPVVQIPLHPHKRLPDLHRIPQIRHRVMQRVVVAQLQQWGELV